VSQFAKFSCERSFAEVELELTRASASTFSQIVCADFCGSTFWGNVFLKNLCGELMLLKSKIE
jgi:hypothetical protein